MKHLILCHELPPAPGGGIGTYVQHLSRLLAESGEQVHVIGVLWRGAERAIEELHGGRLVVHRIPFRDWRKDHTGIHRSIDPRAGVEPRLVASLYQSGFQPLAFAFQASLLAEKLIEEEGIDIIEAQEFEAPLYIFQLRRALGLGPRRQPPCLVHLHSPMELIVRHNAMDIYAPYFQTAKRCEDYSIRAADALLCPSRFLTRQAEEHYGLAPGSIETIPLPLGEAPPVERGPETWREGTICYAGRLELRKGILEWIDAAVRVAREEPSARFELIGRETRVTIASLLQRIPPHLRARFIFRGERPRSEIWKHLSHARMAVVPSRWENFPYACAEAMSSGLPVLVTSRGGMAEMVTDGASGWIAESCRPEDLVSALRRALRTPPEELSRMGRQARESIHRLCDPERILESQLALRRRVVRAGARLSLELPKVSRSSPEAPPSTSAGAGIAIVVTQEEEASNLEPCLASIEKQSVPPVALEVVPITSREVVASNGRMSVAAAANAAVDRILVGGVNPAGFLFLRSGDTIAPHLLSTCESILRKVPELGIVSFWCWQPNGRRAWVRLGPSFPYQWLANEASPMCVIRTAALLAAGRFRVDAAPGYEGWDLVNAVLAAGYQGVTIPDTLATAGEPLPHVPAIPLDYEGRRARSELLSRFPDLAGTQTHELVSLGQSIAVSVTDRKLAALRAQQGVSGAIITARRKLAWVRRNLKSFLRKAARSDGRDEAERRSRPGPRSGGTMG